MKRDMTMMFAEVFEKFTTTKTLLPNYFDIKLP